MNCAEANQKNLVDYLFLLGHKPQKIRNNNYWYLSPLRNEKTASFKIDKNKNVWYDHGIGEGGSLLDFTMAYHKCTITKGLEKINSIFAEKYHHHNNSTPAYPKNEVATPSISDTTEPLIIKEAKQPITDLFLCSYLKKRRIEPDIANKFCHEILFSLNEKNHRAIGFKNAAGGFELRNEYFKGSSAPKYIYYKDNNAKSISVFEGFFDFLSYQVVHKNQEQQISSFLVLNSLSFFERSLLLMEKYSSVELYLDNDDAGRKYTSMALKRSSQYYDNSKLYKGYKDLNEWIVGIGKVKQQQTIDEKTRKIH